MVATGMGRNREKTRIVAHMARFIRLCGALALAASVAPQARAAYQAWVGSASSPCYWDVQANWNYNNNGKWQSSWKFPQNDCIWNINNTLKSFNSTWNGGRTITFRTLDSSNTGSQVRIDDSTASNPIVFVSDDGSTAYGYNGGKNLNISDFSDMEAYLEIRSGKYVFDTISIAMKTKTATLQVTGGEVTANEVVFGKSSGAGNLILEGGTLSANCIKHNSGTGAATVTLDGGILKARGAQAAFIQDNPKLSVAVGENGGTIDSSGYAIGIPAALGGAGGMAFTGGGTITLSGANTYTGGTTVEAGTTLRLLAPGAGIAGGISGGGAMVFAGDGAIALSGSNSYTGGTTIEAGATLQLPMPDSITGDIVVTNATLGACPLTVLTLTGDGVDANDIISRISLAADAPDTIELAADGASVTVVAKLSAPASARLVRDSGSPAWNWRFFNAEGAAIEETVDQSSLEAASIVVRFGSTDELAAFHALGSAPVWAGGYRLESKFGFASASAASAFPDGFTIEEGTVIDLKGCSWTLPDELKSAGADFTVTNSVDGTKSVLTIDVASGTFTETHLTLGGNLELRKTGEGTYATAKDQPHTGGTVVDEGAMTAGANRTIVAVANSTGSLTISGTGSYSAGADFIVAGGANSEGTFNLDGGTFTMTGNNRYFKLGAAAGAYGTVNLNGGEFVMKARGFTVTNGGGEVVFNGGTLKYEGINERPLFQNIEPVKVGARGGTIDFAAGKFPTNNVGMASGVAAGETDGGMKFKGGGTFTSLGPLAYNGGTTVEIGTTLVLSDTSLGGGLAVSMPAAQPAAGQVKTLVKTTGSGSFTDADLPDVSAHPFYRAKLSGDAKSILVERIAPGMAMKSFDAKTRAMSMTFEDVDAEQALVVAWGDRDCGDNLDDWPCAQHAFLGTVAANATDGTFVLPREALVSGNYYRFFLGNGMIEGLEWIQPAKLGAYVNTGFTPATSDKAEFKFNMDARTYGDTAYRYIYAAGSGWGHVVATAVNSSGWMSNTRVGTVRFAELGKVPFSTTEDHVVKLAFDDGANYCFTIDGKNNNGIYHEFTNGSNTDTSTYNTYNNSLSVNTPVFIWANSAGANPSMVKLYYMKWTASNGTTLKANFLPAKAGGEYCLYDTVGGKILRNAGAKETSLAGKSYENYVNAICFAGGQTAASGASLAGTLELVSMDYEMKDATLSWPAPGAAATLWVVYSGEKVAKAPGAFDLGAWDECVKLGDIAGDSTGETYNIGGPRASRRNSMRFIVATADSTAGAVVPLNVSNAYSYRKDSFTIIIR